MSDYSKEYKDVINHMTEILTNEFPTNLLTQEYLILSILDKPKCHAYMLLDNCLMTNHIEELRNIFITYLKEHSNNIFQNTNGIPFDNVLQNILEQAEFEKNVLKNTFIGTEHILLAMLNPTYGNVKMQEIFKNIGIDYNFILNKCNEKNKKLTEIAKNAFSKKNIIPLQNMLPNFPLKSEINPNNVVGKTTYIQSYTIDLSKQASEGKLDELVGRESELTQIINILARRKKNNVVLVGNGGCGKTSMVHGLANLIAQGNVPDIMKDKKIVQLNVSALIAGTYLRGAFEERTMGLFNELKTSNKYILFIDDMHTVLKSSSKEKDTDMSSVLNEILAEGDIRVIGATSFKDYRNTVEINTMIARRLQKMVIEPSSKEDTINILMHNKHYYETHHNVKYTDEAIKKCVELSSRYITERSLPDSAIDIIDFSGAHTCLLNRKPQEILDANKRLDEIMQIKTNMLDNGDFESVDLLLPEENELKAKIAEFEREYKTNLEKYQIVIDKNDIYQAISEITKIPINTLNSDEKKNLANINNVLKEKIVGQDEAIDSICRSIKRNKMGLGNQNKVIASYLCAGPTGVGKTYLAKKIAEHIFGDAKYLVRFDMSEYSDKTSVSKLIGASAGYIGYDSGGLLCEAIKNNPYCVLLIDEIEKANSEIFNIFLQLLDEGVVTDNTGNHINCKNTIVLFTSNIGAQKVDALSNGIGFVTDVESNTKTIIDKEIKNLFKPEFLNRLDQIVYFNSLTETNYKNIVKLELNNIQEQIKHIGYNIGYTDEVVEFISNDAFKDKKMGARPIVRYLQKEILDKITDKLIENDYPNNYLFNIFIKDNNIEIE